MKAGISLFGYMDGKWLTLVLSVTVGSLVVMELSGAMTYWFNRVNFRSMKFLFPFASISGLIVGVTGAGGLLVLSFYVKTILKIPRAIRGTMLLISIIFSVIRVGGLSLAGFVDFTIVAEVIISLPFGLVGGWFGMRFFKHLSDKNYHRILNGIVLLGTSALAIKGVLQLI